METEKVETNSIQIDQFIIAQYDRQCYVGKVKEEDSGEVHVSFMQMRGKTPSISFAWPRTPDEIWINVSDVLFLIDSPIKYKRCWKLCDKDMENFLQTAESMGMSWL